MVKPYLGEGIEDPMGGLPSEAVTLLALITGRGSSVYAKWVFVQATGRLGFSNAVFKVAVLALANAEMIEPIADPLNTQFLSQGRFVVTEKGMLF